MRNIIKKISNFLSPITGTCDCGGNLRTHLDFVQFFTECDKCQKAEYVKDESLL